MMIDRPVKRTDDDTYCSFFVVRFLYYHLLSILYFFYAYVRALSSCFLFLFLLLLLIVIVH